jgi:hypothetical protein
MAQKYKIIFNNQTKNAKLHATDGEKDGKAEKERRKKTGNRYWISCIPELVIRLGFKN